MRTTHTWIVECKVCGMMLFPNKKLAKKVMKACKAALHDLKSNGVMIRRINE